MSVRICIVPGPENGTTAQQAKMQPVKKSSSTQRQKAGIESTPPELEVLVEVLLLRDEGEGTESLDVDARMMAGRLVLAGREELLQVAAGSRGIVTLSSTTSSGGLRPVVILNVDFEELDPIVTDSPDCSVAP